jgi:hypothetical protein
MMGLLLRVLFVTTDVYEKVKLRRLKCIRTMRKQTKMLLRLPKNSSFFHNFLWPSAWGLYQNLRNCTANHVLCFLNQKTNIHVNFANVLWVAFSIASSSLYYHSWNTLYMPLSVLAAQISFLNSGSNLDGSAVSSKTTFSSYMRCFFRHSLCKPGATLKPWRFILLLLTILGPWLKLIKIPF